MASILRIKRSEVSGNPSVLGQGELAYSALPDTGSNGGDRLYIGMGTETSGNAVNHIVIGGRYYTGLIDAGGTGGTLKTDGKSIPVLSATGTIDQWLAGNLKLTANTFSSTNTNGDINITPNGTGKTVISNVYIGDTSTTLQEYIYDQVGGTITAGTGLSSTVSDVNNTTTLSLNNTAVTAGSYGSATAIPTFTVDQQGRLTAAGTVAISSSFTLAADSGTADTFNNGETLTFTGTDPVQTAVSNNTITISVDAATTTTKGIASFSSTNFDVSSGAVSIKSGSVLNSPTFTGTPVAPTPIPGTNTTQIATTEFVTAAVDAARSGLDVKASVRAATTANITLSNTQTVDGVALAVGNRVLVKNQTTGSENGIYVVASGAWTRAADFDSNGEVTSGAFTFVEEGTVNADSGWVVSTDGAITVGTTAITFAQFSGAGQITAGNGLTKTGNTLDVGAGAGITVGADSVGLTGQALALHNLASNGIFVRTAADTIAARSVAGTANRITITNGDGVSGNPTVDIASTYIGQDTITTLGTVTTGVWNASTIAVSYGGTGQTTLTSRGVVYGNGTSAAGVTAASDTEGSFLREDATGAPYWSNVIDGGTY
jgi:hypothetical protein